MVAFIGNEKNEKKALLVNKKINQTEFIIDQNTGINNQSYLWIVDETTGFNPPKRVNLTSNHIILNPFAVAVLYL